MNPLVKKLAPLLSNNLKLIQERKFSSEIFISSLSFYATDDDLRKVFSKFGDIRQVRLIRDGKTQRVKGYAFINYSSEVEAQKAVKVMDGRILSGRLIFVEISKSRSVENTDTAGLPSNSSNASATNQR